MTITVKDTDNVLGFGKVHVPIRISTHALDRYTERTGHGVGHLAKCGLVIRRRRPKWCATSPLDLRDELLQVGWLTNGHVALPLVEKHGNIVATTTMARPARKRVTR